MSELSDMQSPWIPSSINRCRSAARGAPSPGDSSARSSNETGHARSRAAPTACTWKGITSSTGPMAAKQRQERSEAEVAAVVAPEGAADVIEAGLRGQVTGGANERRQRIHLRRGGVHALFERPAGAVLDVVGAPPAVCVHATIHHCEVGRVELGIHARPPMRFRVQV